MASLISLGSQFKILRALFECKVYFFPNLSNANFASLSNKSGKYQIISAEYYSEDAKPFLYKRLVKLDTSTGEAWVLSSKIGSNGEQRKWIPLETKK